MNAIELRWVRNYVTAVEEGSISRAAARLHLTQQSLSQQIRLLERAVGVQLLVRTTRGVTPTAAGLELADFGAVLLSDINSLVQRLRAGALVPARRDEGTVAATG